MAGGGTGGVLLGAFYLWPLLTQPPVTHQEVGCRISQALSVPAALLYPRAWDKATRTEPGGTGRHELRQSFAF